jgi:hypothetical protein
VNIKLGYRELNRDYQKALDKRFSGKIVAIDRYINPKATIKHGCLECGTTFWARPGYLIHLNTTDHFCIQQTENIRTNGTKSKAPKSNSAKCKVSPKKSKSNAPEELNEMLILYNEGVTITEIARKLGLSRDKIRYWLEKVRGL